MMATVPSGADLDLWTQQLAPANVVDEARQFVYHANSPREVWQRLAMLFESGSNLRAHLRRYAGFEPNAAQAEHIAAALRQGREWFRVAATGELMARPVAIYYGMVSFAAAAAMSWGLPKLLDGFKQGHGLRARHLESLSGATVATSGADFLFQTFTQLMIENGPIRVRLKSGVLWLAAGEPSEPFEADLKAVLGRLPLLADLYQQTFDEPPPTIPADLSLSKVGEGPTDRPLATLLIPSLGSDAESIRRRLPVLARWRLWELGGQSLRFESFPPDLDPRPGTAEDQRLHTLELAGLMPSMAESHGRWFLVEPLPGCATSLPQASLMAAGAYLLSSVARYRPDVWSRLLTMRGNDARLRALVEEFLDACESQFPLEALGVLMRGRIEVRARQAAVGA